ncbi:MAG TPA: hypothetical protein VGV18_03440 [Verrucomicrobiae bacterium]|nr:hypothetical protein [Verrucomicrobiae bacterium]
MPMLDLELIENPDKSDIINGLMPVIFNLAVGWWLLGGGLVRRAYPEPKVSQSLRTREQPEPARVSPVESSTLELKGMERAEQKLAALVEKPADSRVA